MPDNNTNKIGEYRSTSKGKRTAIIVGRVLSAGGDPRGGSESVNGGMKSQNNNEAYSSLPWLFGREETCSALMGWAPEVHSAPQTEAMMTEETDK